MADVILKRTVFVEVAGGVHRFADFARVITPLGQMVEPFIPGQKVSNNTPIQEYSNTDEMCRIDEIEQIDSDKLPSQLGDGFQPPLHGGLQLSRTGR
jgi:hypothetical protein